MKLCRLHVETKHSGSARAGLLPGLMCVCVVLYAAGCTSSKNYAPVRSYQQKSLNKAKYYVVQKGDTLYSIGFRSGDGYRRLAEWNKISPPYLLKTGQRVKLFQSKQKLRDGTGVSKKIHKSKEKKQDTKHTRTISNKHNMLLKSSWQWPLTGHVLKIFSKKENNGIDIAGKIGQKVRAAASGRVVYGGSGLTGYGNLLIIKHNHLFLSAYANNRLLLVKEGQTVKKGQIIAEVGRVGGQQISLHFEIRKNGKPVNPFRYLPKK
ncbi:MAG: peptidoglycan DD-metalloendopeptidase family protein [Gammaproteobacteria bacterium]